MPGERNEYISSGNTIIFKSREDFRCMDLLAEIRPVMLDSYET